jgi:S-adenosyl-L-methionine hydrolase (adenosine-forming)
MPTISLTTDFGLQDGFVGTLKGVIWSICPAAQIADISHLVPPQNVLAGALTLWRAYSCFPAGSIHVAVVDPGVGTPRRPIAARLGAYYFVGPDNGLFTPFFKEAEKNPVPLEIVHLTNEKYFRSLVSRTFHGRDIFAPVAAHLANAVPLSYLGPSITDPQRLSIPEPEKTSTGWRAHVTLVDVFGNLSTDLPAAAFAEHETVTFRLYGQELHGLVTSYGFKPPGQLVALLDSQDYLEIAIVNGSAVQALGAKFGDIVEVVFTS